MARCKGCNWLYFFVTADGHIITNYHVISKQVHYPERYRTEFIDSSGSPNPVSIIGIDVINDLAIIHAKIKTAIILNLPQWILNRVYDSILSAFHTI